jgi:hypothetical protein
MDLLGGCGRIEIEKGSDVSTHGDVQFPCIPPPDHIDSCCDPGFVQRKRIPERCELIGRFLPWISLFAWISRFLPLTTLKIPNAQAFPVNPSQEDPIHTSPRQ